MLSAEEGDFNDSILLGMMLKILTVVTVTIKTLWINERGFKDNLSKAVSLSLFYSVFYSVSFQ